MFEESFVRAVIRKVESIAREHQRDLVLSVRVQVGPLAETDARVLEATFERLPKSPMLSATQFSAESVPLVLRCEFCHAILERSTPGFDCPACGSDHTVILSGDKVALESVSLAPRFRPAKKRPCRAAAARQESEAVGAALG
jgi:Zn finger protein HypA/HybF involved in hydrogenase expression